MEPTRKPSRDVQGAQPLAANKRFGQFDPEKEQSVRGADVKENTMLQKLKKIWNTYKFPDDKDYDVYYTAVFNLSIVKELDYSAADIEKFTLLLSDFQHENKFSSKVGIFLGALINNGSEETYIIHTDHLSVGLDHLGYRNTKNIVVRGSVGDYAGFNMEGGSMTVEGNAGLMVGVGIGGGSITVKGNAGHDVGWTMEGGEIHLLGDYESISSDIEGGKIYHKGKLIVHK